MTRPTGSTNPTLRKLIRGLREQGKRQKAPIWIELAHRLSKPRRARAEVNLSHLSRYWDGGNVVVVPGKVLAAGKLDRPLRVAAFKFSHSARRKIVGAGGEALTIHRLLEENPRGKGVRIME